MLNIFDIHTLQASLAEFCRTERYYIYVHHTDDPVHKTCLWNYQLGSSMMSIRIGLLDKYQQIVAWLCHPKKLHRIAEKFSTVYGGHALRKFWIGPYLTKSTTDLSTIVQRNQFLFDNERLLKQLNTDQMTSFLCDQFDVDWVGLDRILTKDFFAEGL